MSATCEAEIPRIALTLREAAESVGVSLKTLRRHILPTIKATRFGNNVLIRPSDLDEWIQRHGTLNTPYN